MDVGYWLFVSGGPLLLLPLATGYWFLVSGDGWVKLTVAALATAAGY